MNGLQDIQGITTLLSLLLVKPFVLLLIAGLLSVVWGKEAVETRYQILSIGFLSVVLLFPLEFFLPSYTLYWLPEINEIAHWGIYVIWGYSLFVFVGMTNYFNDLLGLEALARRAKIIPESSKLIGISNDIAERIGLQQSITLKVSSDISGPFVWGWLKPEVILPQDFSSRSQREIEHVLLHELSHIYRNDWIMLVIVKWLCVLLWFIPGIHWLADKHQEMSEQACDKMVVRCEADAVDYAEDLLKFAKHKNSNLALNVQGQSPLFARLAILINGGGNREQFNLSVADYMFLCGLVLVVAVSSLRIDFIQNAPRYLSFKAFPYDEIKALDEPKKKTTVNSNPLVKPIRPDHHIYKTPEKSENLSFYVNPEADLVGEIILEPVVVQTLSEPHIGQFNDFEVIHEVRPYYPIDALQRRIEGFALVTFDISKDGDVLNPKVTEASHKRIFDAASLQAIRKFKFSPVQIAGEAHGTEDATVCFKFEVHERSPPVVTCPE